MTPLQLWEVLTGRKKHEQSNMAIDKGVYWEPKVRAKYELDTGLDFPAKNFEDGVMRASLDGWCEEKKIVLEIKVPGKEVIALARQGIVHPMYVWQLEHQIYVPGAVEAHFVCGVVTGKGAYDGELKELVTVVYKSDLEKRRELLAKEVEFWDYVQSDTPPPLTDRDALVREDAIAKDSYSKYKELYLAHDKILEEAEKIEKEMDLLKKEIADNMKHSREECSGVQFLRVTTSRIDYKRLQEDVENIEQYKKESTYIKARIL
jgi:predicted phage-related endonuclease